MKYFDDPRLRWARSPALALALVLSLAAPGTSQVIPATKSHRAHAASTAGQLAITERTIDPPAAKISVLRSATAGFAALGKLASGYGGALYGTTDSGGLDSCSVPGCGVAYILSPPAPGRTAWTSGVLHTFGNAASDGANPSGSLLVGPTGVLYGTTTAGGGRGECSGSCGTVYQIAPPTAHDNAWRESVLYAFAGEDDGSVPNDGLIADSSGTLYGTTRLGGASNLGTVFKLSPPRHGQDAWIESALYAFSGDDGDGSQPNAGLIADGKGDLFGTTAFGGGDGTVFELEPPRKGRADWTELVLHSFSGGADGASPIGSLIGDARGDLFGETEAGGIPGGCDGYGCGVIFELVAPVSGRGAWTERILHTFSGGIDDYGEPLGGLTADSSGALYGVIPYAGTYGFGDVFKLTPPAAGQNAWTESSVYAFTDGQDDGAVPFAGVIVDSHGAIYGTTTGGGSRGQGTVYRLQQP